MDARTLGRAGLFALAACSANDDVPAPSIGAVMPDRGVPGTIVSVTGSYLCQQPRSDGDVDPLACAHVGAVLFGATPGIATAYMDTQVLVAVPALAPGRVSLVVAVAGRSSNSVGFIVE